MILRDGKRYVDFTLFALETCDQNRLLAQHTHAVFQAVHRQGKHAIAHQLPNYVNRLKVLPQALLFRIASDKIGERVDEALQPFGASFFVVMLDLCVELQNLIGAHGGIADEN